MYLADMDFEATVSGEIFQISFLRRNCYLISKGTDEYIVYKADKWKCAEDLEEDLLEDLGEAIDRHLSSINGSAVAFCGPTG